jgi:peptidoglycan/xylan/chitin deacetylase (PgdA/CDA1 family)
MPPLQSGTPSGASFQQVLRRQPELWDHFTRREEYDPVLLDRFQRFPYSASACRYVFEPVVSSALVEHGLAPEWPEDHEFGVCLTHDIDWVYTSSLARGRVAVTHLLRKDVAGCYRSIVEAVRAGKRWPLCNFERIMALEEEFGARSSFYFMVQDPEEEDYSYEIEDLHADLAAVRDRGCEVGLHGGYSCYRNFEELQRRKARLSQVIGAPVAGYRNHYLCFSVPDTWELLARAGFRYDTTFGYHDCVGFRNGMCHPFAPFDRTLDREIPIIEIPLIISDMALFTYMRLDLEGAWRRMRELIDRVAAVRGVVTILWHNGSVLGPELGLYRRVLQYCREKNAWMATCEDTARWWNDQHWPEMQGRIPLKASPNAAPATSDTAGGGLGAVDAGTAPFRLDR